MADTALKIKVSPSYFQAARYRGKCLNEMSREDLLIMIGERQEKQKQYQRRSFDEYLKQDERNKSVKFQLKLWRLAAGFLAVIFIIKAIFF